MTEMTMPIASRAGTCTTQRDRSMLKRLLSQKTNGVSTAQIHDSMNASAIGPTGEIPRKPNPRGSRRRLTEASVASDVQKTKMRNSSRRDSRLQDAVITLETSTNDAVRRRRSFHRRAVRDADIQIDEMPKGRPRAICRDARLATSSNRSITQTASQGEPT